MRPLLILCLTLMASPVLAEDISRCVIEVDGKTWADGPCSYESLRAGDGSFMVSQAGTDKAAFAYVYDAEGNQPGYGFWNGPQLGTHAHDKLGDLKHDGACWSNDRAKVCAYR